MNNIVDKKEEMLQEANFIMTRKRFVIVGFILIVLIFKKINLLNISSRIIGWLFLWFFTTFFFDYLIKKVKTIKAIENFHFFYFLFDLIILTIGVHYAGSISWIAGIFYSFTIIYAYFILPRKKALVLTMIAVFILFNGLVMLEFFGYLPHQLLFEISPFDNISYVVITMFMINIFLMFLAVVLGFFANILREKKEKVETIFNQIEEERKVLEIKVNARTREAREFVESLKEKVKEKTQKLREKKQELENFNKLTKGREEKLKELEGELKKIKALSVFSKNS